MRSHKRFQGNQSKIHQIIYSTPLCDGFGLSFEEAREEYDQLLIWLNLLETYKLRTTYFNVEMYKQYI